MELVVGEKPPNYTGKVRNMSACWGGGGGFTDATTTVRDWHHNGAGGRQKTNQIRQLHGQGT